MEEMIKRRRSTDVAAVATASTTSAASTNGTSRQWKARSMLLLPPLNHKDKGAGSVEPGAVIHSGFLNKLTGKNLLNPGTWKRRYCVLDSQRLYFYEAKEDQQQNQRQDHDHSRELTAGAGYNLDKTSSYISLQHYDGCEEANIKEVRKATNVFVISSSNDKTFFETGRLYFSAETLTDMKEWITQIRNVIKSQSTSTSSTGTVMVGASSHNNKKRADSSKSNSSIHHKPSITDGVITEELNQPSAAPTTPSAHTAQAEDPGTRSGDLSISSLANIDHLECITKQRARGPVGRRLPRQRFTLAAAYEDGDHGRHQRSESLPRIETDPPSRVVTHHNRSFDLLAAEDAHVGAGLKSAILKTVYTYSSSDDSLNASFASSGMVAAGCSGGGFVAATVHGHLPQYSTPNHPFVQQQSDATKQSTLGSTLKGDHDEFDSETCETLCEIPIKLHSSTPSLSANPLAGHPFQWDVIGSSSTAPSSRQKRRQWMSKNPVVNQGSNAASLSSVGGAGGVNGTTGSSIWSPDISYYSDRSSSMALQLFDHTSTDDPEPGDSSHGFGRVLQSLQAQAALLKSTLTQLETDWTASRRDMGSLQENLSTVQNAASSVADKVTKMQVTVTTMERQIFHAVKEAQNLQQRASEALTSATSAEKHYRQLESECQILFNQLSNKRDTNQPILNSEDLCISPMTPNAAPLASQHSTLQPSSINNINNNNNNNLATFTQAATGFSPIPVRAFSIPQTFDFATLLAGKTNATSTSTPTMTINSVPANGSQEGPKIKSSLRTENRGGSKSISFGPITTFAAPLSPTPSHSLALMPDFNVAVATSTLKKTMPSTTSTYPG